MHNTDILIIGAGPIGLFTIFQAGMLGMKCHIIESQTIIGGQCNILYPEKPIYDIPGYPKITGSDLIIQLEKQAQPFKPIYHLNQKAIKLEQINNYFQITTNKNTIILSKVIIIAAGSGIFSPNKPNIKNIETFEKKSIFYHIKHRNIFVNKTITIIGGGNSALEWAILLSEIAKKIYLIHRREKFRALENNINKLNNIINQGKIKLIPNYQLERLINNNSELYGVVIKNFKKKILIIPTNILLLFFGLKQNIGPIQHWGFNFKNNHIIVNPPSYETNISGIYAVGDICYYPGKLKLILTGFSEATNSIYHSYNKIFENQHLNFQHSTVKGIKYDIK